MIIVLLAAVGAVLYLLSLLSPDGLDAGYGPYDEATEAFGFNLSCVFLFVILVLFLAALSCVR